MSTYRNMWRTLLIIMAMLGVPGFPVGVSHAGSSGKPVKEYQGASLLVRLHFKPLPEKMPGSRNDTPEMVALGRKLYFEKGISLTKSQSCNDCHRLDNRQAGVDNLPTSKGARGDSGKRNSPTVLNAGFHAAQFWDGRAADLVNQAKGPVLNPVEMAMRSEEDVITMLKERKDYRDGFKAAFPLMAEPVTFDNLALAIAAFERTLITPSRFDRYLRGQQNALTADEKRGLKLFVETGCIECHNGVSVGGRMLEKFGIYHPYENQTDRGRYHITRHEKDAFVFKVPGLRNVTLTAPYFHDGQVALLPEAVRRMAWMQLDRILKQSEVNEIVRFLFALEGEQPLVVVPPVDPLMPHVTP